jgi:hypothetical protein
MTTLQELREQALEAVRLAFPVEEPPSADRVRNDHCPECAETSEIFLGRRWTDITVEDLAGNPALPLLTSGAFRYYLPALMTCAIEAPVELDCVPDSLVALLSPARGEMSDRDKERLSGFTGPQVRAILMFLMFFQARELNDESASTGVPPESIANLPSFRVVTRALEYWSKEAGAVSS